MYAGPTSKLCSSNWAPRLWNAKGSRVLVRLFNDRRVFHRPHPEPTTDKGAVESIRKWLEENGVKP
jgi:hypothetical protein